MKIHIENKINLGSHLGSVGEDVRPGESIDTGIDDPFCQPNRNEHSDKTSNEKNEIINNEKPIEKNLGILDDSQQNINNDFVDNNWTHSPKNKIQKKNIIKIATQNIRGFSEEKQDIILNDIKYDDNEIISFTEISLSPKNEKLMISKFKNFCKVFTSSKQEAYKGNGIVAFVKYPLANRITSFRKIEGRILNIILRMKGHKEISMYFIQAPTAPYRDGAAETEYLAGKLKEMFETDICNQREILLGGDCNSYPDKTIDYEGNQDGQEPSKLIKIFLDAGLIDIMRLKYDEPFFTFIGNNMVSRLDQYWVSADIASKTVQTCALKIEPYLSDHSVIEIGVNWPHRKKLIIKPINSLKWDNKNEAAMKSWSEKWIEKNVNLLFSAHYQHREFYKEYVEVAKSMRSITRKVFGSKVKRTKPKKNPPIWYRIMRNIGKIIMGNDAVKKETDDLLSKYFPTIDVSVSWECIRTQLRTCIKSLYAERKKKRILEQLTNRYNQFNESISDHLDKILERKQIIDSSFVLKGEAYITEVEEVKDYFLTYYNELFYSDSELPTSLEIDRMEYLEETKVTSEILLEEYMMALNHLAKNKAAGISGMKKEMLMLSPLRIHEWLLGAFNEWLKLHEIPKYILRSQIWLIPKGIYDGNPSNTRPINLIEIPRKLLSTILVRRLSYRIENDQCFQGINFGFRQEMGAMDAIKTLQIVIEHSRIFKRKLCLVLLDIKKAYDSLSCHSIVSSLKEMKVEKSFIKLMVNTFQQRRSRVLTMAGPTKFFHPIKGVEQGDPASPLVWNIYYETILKKLNLMNGYQLEGTNISYMAYADDIILMAETEEDIRALVAQVNELLNENNMEIQAKKSIMVANFYCGEVSIRDLNNDSKKLTEISSDETFKYLGAIFSLSKNASNIKEVQCDLQNVIEIMIKKRISARNASYIFNHVVLPKISYKLSGMTAELNKIDLFDKMIRSYFKKLLQLPVSFSTKYLYSSEYLIRLKPLADYYVEQELSNFYCILQKRMLPGNIFTSYLESLQKCHPIFAGPLYVTKSPLVNQLWEWIEERNISLISLNSLNNMQEKNYTCQFLKMSNHSELADAIVKYKLFNITDMYRIQRDQITLKRYSSVASKKELMQYKEKPAIWNFVETNEFDIIKNIENATVMNHIVDLTKFEQEIIKEYIDKLSDNEVKNTIWTDGSYNPDSNEGGAAAIIEKNDGEVVTISKHLPYIKDSTEAEAYGIWIGLIIAKVNGHIQNINTDSKAIIAVASSSLKSTMNMIKEGNWTIRNRIRELVLESKCKINWVKAHNGLIQNELADMAAKTAAQLSDNYKAYINMKGKMGWIMLVNGIVCERYPRELITEINSKARSNNLNMNSDSFSNHIHDKNTEQIECWKKSFQYMSNKFNITFKEERLLSFVLKLHAGILPCNLRQFCWGFAKYSNCSLCDATDDNVHFTICPNLRNELVNELYGAVEKCQSVRWERDPNLMSLIKRSIIDNFNISTAMGIISIETISIWKDKKLDMPDLHKLGKNILIAMHSIWKQRCKENKVKYEKTIPMPIQGASNYKMIIPSKELLKITSKEVIFTRVSTSCLYW